ncbi:MAG: hypothetical protein GY715_03245, partial [Planctomycetes bacterium]|nr:hypothetical protein [Planctomycetota bacterium]
MQEPPDMLTAPDPFSPQPESPARRPRGFRGGAWLVIIAIIVLKLVAASLLEGPAEEVSEEV